MTINIAKLPRPVTDALRKRGFTEPTISMMTPEEVFDQYCMWNGLIGWGPDLRNVLDTARKAAT